MSAVPEPDGKASKFQLPEQLQRAMDARHANLKQKQERQKQEKATKQEKHEKKPRPRPAKQPAKPVAAGRTRMAERVQKENRPERKPKPKPAAKPAKPKGACVSEIDKIKERRETRRKAALAEQAKIQAELDIHGDVGVENIRFRQLVTEARKTALEQGGMVKPGQNGRLQVVVRKRPLNGSEKAGGGYDVVTAVNPHTVCVHETKHTVDMQRHVTNHSFVFDRVYHEASSNEEVYEGTIGPLVECFVHTPHARVTCFAYGQTGSGKTYTMTAMLQLALQEVFRTKPADTYLGVSFFEVYMAKVYDCLSDRARLEVQEDHAQNVIGLCEELVESHHQAEQVVERGFATRITRDNKIHQFSSRSHAVVQLTLREPGGAVRAKMSLVDLAGSERASDTSSRGADRQSQLEGAEINKSLLALKECIRAMEKRDVHVPFRGSKLSLLLKDSFVSKMTRTTVLANIGPASCSTDHTLNTLRYADRCSSISAAREDLIKEPEQEELITEQRPPPAPSSSVSCSLSPQHTEDASSTASSPVHAPDRPVIGLRQLPDTVTSRRAVLPECSVLDDARSQLSQQSEQELESQAWEQNALFRGVKAFSPASSTTGRLSDGATRIKPAPSATPQPSSPQPRFCSAVQAEAGLRLAERHSEVMSQFSAIALDEEQKLALFATNEQDHYESYAEYAHFVQECCARRMELLRELHELATDWVELDS